MKATLASLFPLASKSCAERNPQLSPTKGNKTIPAQSSARLRGNMNATESEFALKLEAQRLNGEILRYEYEGITLRFAGVRYTPDFVVCSYDSNVNLTVKFIEVKGAFTGGKYERAIERFRHARTFWPEFSFELHQRTKQGWKRLH